MRRGVLLYGVHRRDNLGIVKEGLPSGAYTGYMQALGAANRTLNGIKGDHFGPLLGGAPGSDWRQVFLRIVEDVLGDGQRRGVDLGWAYDLVRRLVARHADCLDEVTEPVFVEWDLWDSNVMVRDGTIVAIIDHERALYGDPLMEAGFIATQDVSGFGDPAPFVRGYGRAPLTPTEAMRRRLYTLHLILIMVIETVYRGHTEPAQYDWARARLGEVMASFGYHT